MQRRFTDDGNEFDRLILLGGAYRRLTDIGEVLVALDQVTDGDASSWVTTFSDLGERLEVEAAASAARGHDQSARSADLRACSYFATAAAYAVGSLGPDASTALWERHRSAWDRASARFHPPVEKIAIPYHDPVGHRDVELEGYFFSPAPGTPVEGAAEGAAHGDRRPTVIFTNGSDGPISDIWASGAAAAVERGWNAVTYDGPGQGTALYRQGLFFRHDWEAVLTPVVDHVLARGDVDPRRVAAHGVSQAGYWVPRALAFEHRLAAAVADPGVTRVADSWIAHLPESMVGILDGPDPVKSKSDFDAFMDIGMTADPAGGAELRWRMAPFGTDSYFDAYQAARAMRLDAATAAQIGTPLLITAPDGEQFWPGQSVEMHQLVPGSSLVAFTEGEGASWHCEPAAHGLRDERVMNWLAEVFARA